MVFRIELTYDEMEKNSDIKCIDSDSLVTEPPPAFHGNVGINNSLPSLITVEIHASRSRTVRKNEPNPAAIRVSFSERFLDLQNRNESNNFYK